MREQKLNMRAASSGGLEGGTLENKISTPRGARAKIKYAGC